MRQLLSAVSRGLKDMLPGLGPAEPIRTVAELAEFLGERAAFVGQTSLYGYLKTRMGTQYAAIFQDPTFQPSLTTAREQAFFGCLEDLSIHAVGLVRADGAVPVSAAASMAEDLFSHAARHAMREVSFDAAPADTAFRERLLGLDWSSATNPGVTFQSSQAVLVAAAPVIDSYREADREIIENSVKFRWIDIRRQLADRLDAAAVLEDAGATV
ncbi:MAG: hypothetical protein AAGH68_04540 [Pseudomonadota bacterium]